MTIVYNIDLTHYSSILQRNYLNFSTSELGGILLCGYVVIGSKTANDFFHFEADLLKFSYDLYDLLLELKSSKSTEAQLHNVDQRYEFELKKKEDELLMTLNKKHTIVFNFDEFIKAVANMKKKLLVDFKILFSNYSEIKNAHFIMAALSR